MYAICPFCHQKYEIEQEHIGVSTECINCKQRFVIREYQGGKIESVAVPAVKDIKIPARKEYKVLTRKDDWLTEEVNPEALENILNEYASQGWRVVSAVTAQVFGILAGKRDEIVIILERDKI